MVWTTLFAASAAGVMFFVVGDLSDPIEPRDADYLWRPWPFLREHETLVGVASVAAFAVAGCALVRAWRAGRMPAPLPLQAAVVVLFSAWLGLGYRVITAGVVGANIGGGVVWLLTPLLGVVTVGLVAVLGAWHARPTTRSQPPG